MRDIINLIPVLGVAMILNIALGTYYNIGVKSFEFDSRKLISGIIKADIIAFSFIGISYCFDSTDLTTIGITPTMILNSAIILYTGKDILALAKILGVKTDVKG